MTDDIKRRCLEYAIQTDVKDPLLVLRAALRFEWYLTGKPAPLDPAKEKSRYVAEIDRWLYWHGDKKAWMTFAPEGSNVNANYD